MHLIAPLAAGVAGAENGTVDIYSRGTSTRATYYSDFEGDTAVTPTASIDLDSNGGVLAYVNELVDVVVKDSSGTTVRSFTAGDASGNVEVRSASFTGVDYTTGASAASNPTTLQEVLDAWFTSAGAVDFKVLKDGSATTLQSAIVDSPYYNVVDYGAVGDGTTDDTTAIQAAIDAAVSDSSGGVVFFPATTDFYLITAELDVKRDVSLLGEGGSCTVIKLNHATATAIGFSTASTGTGVFMRGLRVEHSTTNTSAMITVDASSVELAIEECSFGGANTGGDVISLESSSGVLVMRDCYVRMSASAGSWLQSLGSSKVWVERCHFVQDATSWTPGNSGGISADATGASVWISDCYFEVNSTGGTYSVVYVAGGNKHVTGNTFDVESGATSTGIEVSGAGFITLSGNQFDTDLTEYYAAVANSDANSGVGTQLDRVVVEATLTTETTYSIADGNYSVVIITKSTTGNLDFDLSPTVSPVIPGSELIVIVDDASGSGVNVGFSTTYFESSSPTTSRLAVGANDACSFRFVRVDDSGVFGAPWVQVGAPDTFTP